MSRIVDRYTQLDAALSLQGIEISPAEVHGIVTGAISNHLKSGKTPNLLSLIVPKLEKAESSYNPLIEVLNEIYRDTSDSLLEGDENFEMMVLDDDESLDDRVDSLASWCRGYMLGLLYNDAFSIDQLPESGAEIARDIMQISEAASGIDDEKEEDWALAELHEYVKVGTQLIFEFIYTERSSDTPPQAH